MKWRNSRNALTQKIQNVVKKNGKREGEMRSFARLM